MSSGCGMLTRSDPGEQLALGKSEELLLVRPDLVDVDMVEAGLLVLVDLLEDRLRVGAAGDALGDVVLGPRLRRLLEVLGQRELLAQRAREAAVRPDLVCVAARLLLVLAPADVHHPDPRLVAAAFGLEVLDDL